MRSLLIADDEPKIRKGLSTILPWKEYGFGEIIFAENGKEAQEQALLHRPALCLIDICMPMMNGLQFIEQLKQDLPDTVCIIISGYDEFSYVQQALRMGIFDYLLKPIVESSLKSTVEKALDYIGKSERDAQLRQQIQALYEKNMSILREQFLRDLFNGLLTEPELRGCLNAFRIQDTGSYGLVLVELPATGQLTHFVPIHGQAWKKDLLLYGIRNISEEYLGSCGAAYSFVDQYDNVCLLVMIGDEKKWEARSVEMRQTLYENLHVKVSLRFQRLKHLTEAAKTYSDQSVTSQREISPVVRAAQAFIRQEYENQQLSIRDASQALRVSASYLTTLFRNELGMTFNEYVTNVRMQQAVVMLQDPRKRIVEIAEAVGYSSQHYFCTVFKNVMGQPPSEYRQKS